MNVAIGISAELVRVCRFISKTNKYLSFCIGVGGAAAVAVTIVVAGATALPAAASSSTAIFGVVSFFFDSSLRRVAFCRPKSPLYASGEIAMFESGFELWKRVKNVKLYISKKIMEGERCPALLIGSACNNATCWIREMM